MNNGAKPGEEREFVFSHEKLDVYRILLEYLELEHTLTRKMRSGTANLRDELDRAADSMLLNYGEASGKLAGSKDRARYLRISAGSATESAAAWDVARVRGFTPVGDVMKAKRLLHRIVSMLTRMSR
jgi:four helix bundle protein